MHDLVFSWIGQYGYVAIFSLLIFGIVGLPVPDETLLAFSGYLVSKGDLNFAATIAAAFLGSCCGITTSYFIGRYPGSRFIRKYGGFLHVREKKLARVRYWFQRGGKWLLTIGYFVPGLRHLTAIGAGSVKLALPVFALFAYFGALLWSATFVVLGYYLGGNWAAILQRIYRHIGGITLVCLVVLIAFSIYKRVWRH